MNGRVVVEVPAGISGASQSIWLVIRTSQANTLGSVEARCATFALADGVRDSLNATDPVV